MIKRTPRLEKFYRELEAKENLTYKEAVRICDAMHKEAVALGAISHENIWDGFEVDLRIAKTINGLKRVRKANKKDSSRIRRQ